MKKPAIPFLLMVIFFSVFDTDSFSETASVTIQNFAYHPQTLIINAGDQVMWTNLDSAGHTATSGANCPTPDGKWNSGLLDVHALSYTTPPMTFISPGTYPYFCSIHCETGVIIVNAVAIPLPTGQQIFPLFSAASPVLSTSPSQAEPIGIGAVAAGGDTFSVQIGLDQASDLVDVYLAASGPSIGPDVLLLTEAGTLQPISAGLVPWMSGVTGPINIIILTDTPTSTLEPGTYTIYLAMAPHDSMSSYYLWITNFTI